MRREAQQTKEQDPQRRGGASHDHEDPQSIGPLKGIARFVRDRGDVRVVCLLYALAGARIEEAEGPQAASREFGMAAALARRHGSQQLTGALYVVFEQSDSPPPNARDDRDIWFMSSTDGGDT